MIVEQSPTEPGRFDAPEVDQCVDRFAGMDVEPETYERVDQVGLVCEEADSALFEELPGRRGLLGEIGGVYCCRATRPSRVMPAM